MNQKFSVTGMSCSACSANVERTVKKLNGVQIANVNLLSKSMVVEFDDSVTDSETIIKAVKGAGYGASLFLKEQESASKKENTVSQELSQMKKRIVISLVFWIPLMYLAMHHMLKEWIGLPVPVFVASIFDGTKNGIAFSFTQLLLLTPIVCVNRSYFKRGFQSLIKKAPNMDSLIAIGSSAAIAYGIYAIFKIGYGLGTGDTALVNQYLRDIYFESAGTILTLITLGKYMEARSKGKTSEAITKLMDLAPKTAVVFRNGKETEIPISDVVVEDIILVKPGQSVPVDGILMEGQSSVDQSAITGESIPVEKKVGDQVIAPSINKNGYFKLRAQKVGDDTTLSQIIRLVEDAASSKAPIAKLADKISGIFVPTVMGIAIMAALCWFLLGQTFEFSLSIGIAVLVISCPCALGLATPVAIMVGTGKGAQNGILIKSAEALETAHKVQTVILDKTGTITEGKPKVTDIISLNQMPPEKLLSIAASFEKLSEHPLAEAILKKAEEQNSLLMDVAHFKAVSGRGIKAVIDKTNYLAGNAAMMIENHIDLEDVEPQTNALAQEGKTPLYFAANNRLIGVIAVADVVKATSANAIRQFKQMGIRVVMLTGDNKRTAQAIQKQLEIDEVEAEVMPQEKENVVREIQKSGQKVAMIGDGINDAPALARADVGIAIGAGTDIAIDSADIVLMKNDLLDAVTAVQLSKATVRNIKENLFWAFLYNSIGIPLAAGIFYSILGWKLNPMIGAAAMSLSSVCVVTNALRLKLFKPKYYETR